MAKLSAAARHALPKKAFAGKDESYPIPDENHARAALTGASHAQNVGNISDDEEQSIKAKVHRKFPSIGQKVMKGNSMKKEK